MNNPLFNPFGQFTPLSLDVGQDVNATQVTPLGNPFMQQKQNTTPAPVIQGIQKYYGANSAPTDNEDYRPPIAQGFPQRSNKPGLGQNIATALMLL